MNEVVREWIDKSEGDYLTATREAQAIPGTPYNGTKLSNQPCFVTW